MSDHLEALVMRIDEEGDPVWTPERVRALFGGEVSADTCGRLLQRAERMLVLVQMEDRTWIRPSRPGSTQRDWYC